MQKFFGCMLLSLLFNRSGIIGLYSKCMFTYIIEINCFPKLMHHFTFPLAMYDSCSPLYHQHLVLSVFLF